MIEDPEAVDDIDAHPGVPGVDAAFIGQGDLTQTLGDRAQAQALVDRALAACVAQRHPGRHDRVRRRRRARSAAGLPVAGDRQRHRHVRAGGAAAHRQARRRAGVGGGTQ